MIFHKSFSPHSLNIYLSFIKYDLIANKITTWEYILNANIFLSLYVSVLPFVFLLNPFFKCSYICSFKMIILTEKPHF